MDWNTLIVLNCFVPIARIIIPSALGTFYWRARMANLWLYADWHRPEAVMAVFSVLISVGMPTLYYAIPYDSTETVKPGWAENLG
jgi:hypothetical protein